MKCCRLCVYKKVPWHFPRCLVGVDCFLKDPELVKADELKYQQQRSQKITMGGPSMSGPTSPTVPTKIPTKFAKILATKLEIVE